MTTFASAFEQDTFLSMRPLVVRLALLGATFCFVALFIKDMFLGFSQPALYGWVLVAVVGAFGCHYAKGMAQLFWSGLIGSIACAGGFGSLVRFVDNPSFWFLPIGLCITLSIAPVYHRATEYVFAALVVWVVLVWVVDPHFSAGLGFAFILLIVFGSVCAGITMSVLFRQLRQKSFNLQQQLFEAAHNDALTGLPNRRAFMHGLPQVLDASNAGTPLYFLMLDIDDFKKINDHFGHDVGDLALKEVAKILQTQATGHRFARLGGEEFAVIAQLDVAGACALAQRIVQAVNASFVKDRRLSLSIGMSQHMRAESDASLMRRADEALYEAKRTGKNRYVMAPA